METLVQAASQPSIQHTGINGESSLTEHVTIAHQLYIPENYSPFALDICGFFYRA
jgi:hypothetical protein